MSRDLLVVDDSEVFRRTAVTLLSVRGFTVLVAVPGRDEALAEICRGCPDFVLLDINLIGDTGFEAARAIRAVCPHACVVLTSADLDVVPAEVLQSCGASAFVPKTSLGTIDLAALSAEGHTQPRSGPAST